jgi:hypothetical protein
LSSEILFDGHWIDCVEITSDILGFSYDGVDGRVETMVVLGSKSEDTDVRIAFGHFIVFNQFSHGELVALMLTLILDGYTLIQYVVASVTGYKTERQSAGETILLGFVGSSTGLASGRSFL